MFLIGFEVNIMFLCFKKRECNVRQLATFCRNITPTRITVYFFAAGTRGKPTPLTHGNFLFCDYPHDIFLRPEMTI
jgi:hypothetical protein